MERYLVAIGPSSFADSNDAPMGMLEKAGIEVRPNPHRRRMTEEEIIAHLEGVDGLIAGLEPLNRKVLEKSSRLKAIARVGIGMDNVDLEAAKTMGIRVSNTPDGPTEAVAEMCLASLLALGRNLIAFNTDLHQGIWNKRIGFGLQGMKVLVVGYGRIGKKFCGLLRSLKALVFVADPWVSMDGPDAGETLVRLEEGLKMVDVVTLHASGRDTILGNAEFSAMKPGMILLNSARGELIDESALVNALERGIVASAWLDAFNREPYAGPLTRFNQVLMTPHVSTYTRQCRRSMEEAAVKNLLNDLDIQRHR